MADQWQHIVKRWWLPALIMGFVLVALLLLLIPLLLMQQPSRMNPGILRAISDIRTTTVATETYLMDRGTFPPAITNLIDGGYLPNDSDFKQLHLETITSNTIEIHYAGLPSGNAATEEINRIACRRVSRTADGNVSVLPCEAAE